MTEFLDPRFISISELSRRKALVEKFYKVVNDYGDKTMGGQASSASDGAEKGHQGECRMQDFFRVVKALAELNCFNDPDKVTIDIGSGCGKPGLMISTLTQCTTIGVEVTSSRYDFNMMILKKIHDEGCMPARHFNAHCDATEFSLQGVHTVHFYGIGAPPKVFRSIADRFNESETVEILCLYYDTAAFTLAQFVDRVTGSESDDDQNYNFMVDHLKNRSVKEIRLYHGVDSLDNEDYDDSEICPFTGRSNGATDNHSAVLFRKSQAGMKYAREHQERKSIDAQHTRTKELINLANGPEDAKVKILVDAVKRITHAAENDMTGGNPSGAQVLRRSCRPRPNRLEVKNKKKQKQEEEKEEEEEEEEEEEGRDEDYDEDEDDDEDDEEDDDDEDSDEVSDGIETFKQSDVFHDDQLSKTAAKMVLKRTNAQRKANKKKVAPTAEIDGAALVVAARAEGKVADFKQELGKLPINRISEMRRNWQRLFSVANDVMQDRETMINAIITLLPSGVDYIKLDDASIEELKDVFLSFEFIPPWLVAVLRPDNEKRVFDHEAASKALGKCFDYLSSSELYKESLVHGKSYDELLGMLKDDIEFVCCVQGLFFCPETETGKDYFKMLLDQDGLKSSNARHYLKQTASKRFKKLFQENVVKPLQERAQAQVGLEDDRWMRNTYGDVLPPALQPLPTEDEENGKIVFDPTAAAWTRRIDCKEFLEHLEHLNNAKAAGSADAIDSDEDGNEKDRNEEENGMEQDEDDENARQAMEAAEQHVQIARDFGLKTLGIVHRLAQVKDKQDSRLLSWAAQQYLSFVVAKDKSQVTGFRDEHPEVGIWVLPWVKRHTPSDVFMNVHGAQRLADLIFISEEVEETDIQDTQLLLNSIFGDDLVFDEEAEMIAYRSSLDDGADVPTLYCRDKDSRILHGRLEYRASERLPLRFYDVAK